MDNYEKRSRQFARDLIEYRVPDQARKIAEAILMLSYDLKRDAAPVAEQYDLAAALGINDGDCNTAIGLLESMRVIRVMRCGGRWWYEPRPDAQNWLPRPAARKPAKKSARAGSAEERERMRAAWARLEASGDPQQAKLDMVVPTGHRPMDDGGFDAALLQTVLEQADEKNQSNFGISKVPAPTPRREPEIFGNSKDLGKFQSQENFGNSKDTHAGARARDHEHEHEDRATPYMIHEHAPNGGGRGRGGRCAPPVLMNDEQRDLMRMIEELVTDEEEQRRFRTTWTLRIIDWPNIVFSAIGETRVAKLEHRIDTTPGRYLNDVFKRFRDLRQRPTTTSKSP